MSSPEALRQKAASALTWLPRPFRRLSASRFAVSPLCLFGCTFVPFGVLLPFCHLSQWHRFENCAFSFEGRAKASTSAASTPPARLGTGTTTRTRARGKVYRIIVRVRCFTSPGFHNCRNPWSWSLLPPLAPAHGAARVSGAVFAPVGRVGLGVGWTVSSAYRLGSPGRRNRGASTEGK